MHLLDPVFPITALQKRQAEVREAAKKGIVRLTENGVGAYIFCSEEQYSKQIEQAVEQMLYEKRVAQALKQAHEDVAAGRVYHSIDEAFDEIERRASLA